MTTGLTFSKSIQRLSQRSSNVWDIHDKACARLDAGEEIHLLSVGDPDLATLDTTINHTIESLRKGRTHYSPGAGEAELLKTIAEIEAKASQKPCSPDEVLIYPGATHAIYSVMACLLDDGDEIVVPEPMYIGYHGIFDAIGAKVVNVPLEVHDNFNLDADAVKAAISENTKVLFLNTPGNPAGNMIAPEVLADLAQYCLQRNIWLVCDEVYSMITYDKRHTSIRRAAAKLDNIIIIDGLSKSHAMTGWRLGWSVAPAAVTEKLLQFSSSIIFGCCQFIQDAATFALKNDEAYMNSMREEYKTRRDYAYKRLKTMPGLKCQAPQGGMFLMVDVTDIAADGFAFASDLLDKQGVSVLPGEGFGPSTKGFVRISLTLGVSELEKALDKVEQYTLSLKA